LLLSAEASAVEELLWLLVLLLPGLRIETGALRFAAATCTARAFPPVADWRAELAWVAVWLLSSTARAVPWTARTRAGTAVRAKMPRRILLEDMVLLLVCSVFRTCWIG